MGPQLLLPVSSPLVVSSHIDSGISHVTRFDWWHIRKHNLSRGLTYCTLGLAFLYHTSLPWEDAWASLLEMCGSAVSQPNHQPWEWGRLRPSYPSWAARWLEPYKRLQVQKNQPAEPSNLNMFSDFSIAHQCNPSPWLSDYRDSRLKMPLELPRKSRNHTRIAH